jgi:hypothetical protein
MSAIPMAVVMTEAERWQRIHDLTLPVWEKVRTLALEHQQRHFFWPDFVQLSETDMKIMTDAYGYIPTIKIAGVTLAPPETFVGQF